MSLCTRLAVTLAAWTLAACATSPPTERDASDIRTYSIPAGPGDRSLAIWQRQSGVTLKLPPVDLSVTRMPAVSGRMDSRTAFDKLIERQLIKVVRDDNKVVTLGEEELFLGERLPRSPAFLGAQEMRLRARSPEREAQAAAAKGDFRLAMEERWDGGYHLGRYTRSLVQPGLICRGLHIGLAVKTYDTPVDPTPAEASHSRAALSFLTRYNQTLILQPRFPYRDLCRLVAGKFAPYAGPMETLPQAARAENLGAVRAMIATGRPVDELDEMGRSALAWSLIHQDQTMTAELLRAGASSHGYVFDIPDPLTLALRNKWPAIADELIARGNNLARYTYVALDQPDLWGLARLANAPRPPARELGWSAIDTALAEAAARGDRSRALGLLPYAARDGGSSAAIRRLYQGRAFEILSAYLDAGAGALAGSPAELALWKAALTANKPEAFAFLFSYGAEMGLVSPERLALCERSATAGDIPGLLGCAREAAVRRQAITSAIDAGDETAALSLFAEAADLRQNHLMSFLDRVAEKGSLAAAQALPIVARETGPRFESINEAFYQGRFSAEARTWAVSSGYDARVAQENIGRVQRGPLKVAAEHGQFAVADLLIARAPQKIRDWTRDWLILLSPDADGRAPTTPGAKTVLAAAAKAATARDTTPFLRSFANVGWDDLLEAKFAQGYRPATLSESQSIWNGWVTGGCRPSTFAVLTQGGVRQVVGDELLREVSRSPFLSGCSLNDLLGMDGEQYFYPDPPRPDPDFNW